MALNHTARLWDFSDKAISRAGLSFSLLCVSGISGAACALDLPGPSHQHSPSWCLSGVGPS